MHNLNFTTFVQHDFRVLAIMAIIYDEAFSNSFHQKKKNPYNMSSFSYHNHWWNIEGKILSRTSFGVISAKTLV